MLEQPLLRRPKHRGSFVATWQATRAWQWNLDVLAVGNWVDVSRDGLDFGPQRTGLYDGEPRHQLRPHAALALFARVDNLLDRHYENPVGFLQPSIGVYAGLKVRW